MIKYYRVDLTGGSDTVSMRVMIPIWGPYVVLFVAIYVVCVLNAYYYVHKVV